MYNLLVVDDEVEALDYLVDLCREITSYELYVYSASSGEEALRIMRNVRLDVLLSDIRMPGMDGLELVAQARLETGHCKFILLTGYRNFDTVYRAIQNGDVRYLLKTESEEVIQKAVTDAIEELRSELVNRETLERAQKHLTQMRPLLQNEYLSGLLSRMPRAAPSRERLDELGIALDVGRPLLLAVGRLDNLYTDAEPRMQAQALVSELFEENTPENLRLYLVRKSIYTVCLFQSRGEPPAPEEAGGLARRQVRNVLEYVQNSLSKMEHVTISFVLSAPVLALDRLSESYEELCRVLIRQGSRHTAALLTMENEPPLPDDGIPYANSRRCEQLREFMETGRREQYFSLFQEVCSFFYAPHTAAQAVLEELYYSVAVMLLQFINANALGPRLDIAFDPHRLLQSGSHASWPEAALFLSGLSAHLFELMNDMQKSRTDRIMDVVLSYIAENLPNDLTLNNLAELVHFNQSYFSRLFKQEMNGVNLSEYILSQRMERAKLLLETTSLKIQEIAPMVGYQSSHSFSRLFRSVTGYSPQDYRVMRLCGSSTRTESENR